ncbi:MAG: LacI family transcriptional regulator [Acetatifactor sp.]|nr:LacI family transcriptional regulator [Acetatifactor sp.]
MVSMRDIANACGVSVATVSKALNDHSDIGEETKARIREKAKEMGYLPNAMARALKTNRTFNIGVMFEDAEGSGLTYDYFSYMLDHFKRTVESKGYDITFLNNKSNSRMSYLEHCRYRNFDGVFIPCTDFYDPQVLELVRSDIPVVTIDHVFDNCICVISDNLEGMKELVEYAYACGHRKIAYIHGPDCSVTRARVSSFYNTCAILGMEVPEEYVKEAPYRGIEGSKECTAELLKLNTPPTCIIYPDDRACFGGMSAIKEMGLKVPDDISVIGYDGAMIGQVTDPKLTTLHQDTKTMGEIAGEMLVELIEHPKTTLIRNHIVPGTLIKGESVK